MWLLTSGDGNTIGDGNTHLGYNGGDGYSHYFRGTGTTYIDTSKGCSIAGSLSIGKSIGSHYSMTIG